MVLPEQEGINTRYIRYFLAFVPYLLSLCLFEEKVLPIVALLALVVIFQHVFEKKKLTQSKHMLSENDL